MLLYPASENVGRLDRRPIGSPASLVEECSDSRVRWLEPSEFAGIPLRRKANSNKGNFGHALIVAGSVGKTGAAVMAGSAALKSGAGLIDRRRLRMFASLSSVLSARAHDCAVACNPCRHAQHFAASNIPHSQICCAAKTFSRWARADDAVRDAGIRARRGRRISHAASA